MGPRNRLLSTPSTFSNCGRRGEYPPRSGVARAELADYARGVDEHLLADGEDRDRALSRKPDDLLTRVRVGVDDLVVQPEPLEFVSHPPAERAVVARIEPYACLL